MQTRLRKALSIVLALSVLLSCVMVGTLVSAESTTAEDVKAAAQAYVDTAGNKATQAGLLAALPEGAAIDSFAISHMLPGAVDTDTNADTQFRMDGKAGAVVAVVDVGGDKVTTISTIPYAKETIQISGVAIAGVSDGFTYDASNNITNYSGTADKLVIPADFTGTVKDARNFDTKFKVVVIKNSVAIANQAFINCSSLVAADVGSATINAGTQSFRNCTNLKYFQLNALGGNGGAQGILIQSEAFRFCSNLQNMGIIQNAHSWGSTRLEWASFAGTTALPVLYLKWNSGASINLHNCDYAGTVYTSGTAVTPALLAAELQAMAGAVEYTEGMTGEDVIAAIKASKWLGVYLNKPTNYTLAWKDGFDADAADGKVGGELLLTVGSETFDLNFSRFVIDVDDVQNQIRATFKAYIEQNGNKATAAGALAAVADVLAPVEVTLADGDFYIKHAVDGVYDEDPVAEHRLSIPGYDGYASAVFTVAGHKIGAVERIVHTEYNLGVLTKDVVSASNPNFELDQNNNIIGYTGNAVKLVVPADWTGTFTYITDAAKFPNKGFVRVIMLQNNVQLPNNALYGFAGLEAVSIAGTANPLKNRSIYSCAKLKYLQLPAALDAGSYIGYGNLSHTRALENVNFPTGLIRIESMAFKLSGLLNVYLPSGVALQNAGTADAPFCEPAIENGVRTIVSPSSAMTAARAGAELQEKADTLLFNPATDTADSTKTVILSAVSGTTGSVTADTSVAGVSATFAIEAFYGGAMFEIGFNRLLNCGLENLAVNNYHIAPTFAPQTKAYTLTVPYNTIRLFVTATPVAGVTINEIIGADNLQVGENTLTVKTTALDGSTDVYTITVTRLDLDPNDTIEKKIAAAMATHVFANSDGQLELLTYLNETLGAEGYTLTVEDFYRYKAIGGAVRDNGDMLVPGHDGYLSAVIKAVGFDGEHEVVVTAKIPAPMETYTFASVSQESDYDISEDGTILYGYTGDAELVIIPEGVEVLDDAWSMFADVSKVKALILPESLTKLPLSMVYGMTNLEVCYMGDQVVGTYADTFTKAPSLRYVRLSENLTGIGANMFSFTISLTQLYVPQSVKQIGSAAFSKAALKDITIPYDATSISDYAFEWPSKLPTVFTIASQGALVDSNKAAELTAYLTSIGALNASRVVTVLSKDLSLNGAIFVGDGTGGWNFNIVRAPEGSTTAVHIETAKSGNYDVARSNFQTLNMTMAEAAARAQIMADGLHLSNASTADEVATRIKNAYFGSTLTGDATWTEAFALTPASETVDGTATGVLQIVDSNGLTFDVVINTKVVHHFPVADTGKEEEDDSDNKFGDDFDFGEFEDYYETVEDVLGDTEDKSEEEIEDEFEDEYEDEFEDEFEDEYEDEFNEPEEDPDEPELNDGNGDEVDGVDSPSKSNTLLWVIVLGVTAAVVVAGSTVGILFFVRKKKAK